MDIIDAKSVRHYILKLLRFIESILFRDGHYHNLDLHQKRLERTFEQFMPEIEWHDLNQILPQLDLAGTYKVRLEYDADQEDADYDLEFAEYYPRKIDSLQVVHTEPFDYSFKYEDRAKINQLVSSSGADDIIICMDGYITDSSYANLCFWDGKDWITPESHLLNGVKRQQLLAEKKIKEAPVSVEDIGAFEKISLINAMLDLGEVEVNSNTIRI